MTGSPFSNVLGHDPDDSTFKDIISDKRSDTTSETDERPEDSGTEPSVGVEVSADGTTHESGQDETPGDASSGTPSALS